MPWSGRTVDFGNGQLAEAVAVVDGAAAGAAPAADPSITVVKSGNHASNVTLWTPAAGKKFVLRGLDLDLTAQCTITTPTAVTISVKDGATVLWVFAVWLGTAAAADGRAWFTKQLQLPPPGYVSLAADNVLSVALSSALTAGTLRASAWGREL